MCSRIALSISGSPEFVGGASLLGPLVEPFEFCGAVRAPEVDDFFAAIYRYDRVWELLAWRVRAASADRCLGSPGSDEIGIERGRARNTAAW